ncbi:histidine phosphatase family protein [Companilactobacillus mishanensis]|uniref:Histidine phosphatase family protein n=1 Tax=Companilactobacillus mishanensis TaxID=2486008 RepID=A0ABW9P8R3_9LACO|nr:histidine phosphatase family protein [Companilactobacillus mishanensis]MQS45548.1 histidine phosphatase family protein [Companilactobacillus mishanensis]
MVELYVVRHGETDTNSEGRINGMLTNKPLNETGKKQVEELAKEMNVDQFDEIYTSPLSRAVQTARILDKGMHPIIIEEPRLYETDYGTWDGMSEAKITKEHPEAMDENGFLYPNFVNYAENAEDYDSVYKRVEDFVAEMQTKGDAKILAVCHGFISRAIFKVVTGIPDISTVVQPDNAGVSKYRLTKEHRYVLYYARTKDIM